MELALLLLVGAVSTTLASPILVGEPVLIQAHNERDTLNYRLDDHVRPIHYDINLTPYFEEEGTHKAYTFDGVVKIQIQATQANVDQITLHANRLTIGEWSVYPDGEPGNPLNAAGDPRYDNTTHKLELPLIRLLSLTVVYVIEIKYVGELANDMYGFYRSSYSEGGVTKWLASTQFQATSARRAFPCFDEPKFKATFQLTMNRPEGFHKTISNTQMISESPLGTRMLEIFERTPIMSSYLLAFVVSQYEGRSNEAGNQTTFTRPGAIEQAVFAVSFSDAVLKEFDTYTNFPYLSVPEMKKLDQAAIPDFSGGAMENWGLMTYREMLVLVAPSHTTTLQKQRIASVISHEVAHQWFGDLVTCEWWDNMWLNEGFATYFQYFATHWVENQWELDLQFIVEQHQSAFQMDALESTHAMTNEVNSPAQISASFNSINYNKAGSVLRMMEHMMGPTIFKTGLQTYLQVNKFANTLPGHLLAEFQKAIGDLPSIGEFMSPWVTQPGYPYVTVSVSGVEVTVTQKRFLVNDKDHTDTTTWPIALTFATRASEFANTLPQQFYNKMDGAEKKFSLTAPPAEYFIVNNQQTGYYRVNYDEENWSRIRTALYSDNHGGIHVANRAQIVDDLFNFARAGIVGYSTALDILGYIKAEKSYTPWLAFFNGLSHVTRRITGDIASEEFAHFVLEILSEIYENLGYEARTADTHTQILLRNNVLTWACRYGHEDCLEKSRAEYTQFVLDPTNHLVNPDHRAIVYCQGLRDGDLADLIRLWDRYLSANVAHEQITIINAMGCTRTTNGLNVFLDTILTDAIRYQDKGFALTSALSGNPENVDVVFDFMTQNYEKWATNFDFDGMVSVASAFSAIADRFTRTEQVTRLNEFLTANAATLGDDITQSIRSAVTEAEWQIEWSAKNSPNVLDFLVDRRGSATITVASCLSVILAIVVIVV